MGKKRIRINVNSDTYQDLVTYVCEFEAQKAANVTSRRSIGDSYLAKFCGPCHVRPDIMQFSLQPSPFGEAMPSLAQPKPLLPKSCLLPQPID